MRFTHPEETRAAAKHCFEQGLGYKASAKMIRVPALTVRDWLRQWRKDQFALTAMWRGITIEEQQAIYALRCRGMAWKDIAQRFGCSETTAKRYYHKELMVLATRTHAVKNTGSALKAVVA